MGVDHLTAAAVMHVCEAVRHSIDNNFRRNLWMEFQCLCV